MRPWKFFLLLFTFVCCHFLLFPSFLLVFFLFFPVLPFSFSAFSCRFLLLLILFLSVVICLFLIFIFVSLFLFLFCFSVFVFCVSFSRSPSCSPLFPVSLSFLASRGVSVPYVWVILSCDHDESEGMAGRSKVVCDHLSLHGQL